MRRTGLLIAGWALATAFALVLGLQAVSAISDSVTSHPKASLSPASVKAALDRSNSSESSSAESDSSSDSPLDSSLSVSSSNGNASASSSGNDHGGPLPQSSPPDESSSSSAEPSEGNTASSAGPIDRTYQLVGGSVGVRFENGEAHLLWATPNSGFQADSSGDSSSVDVRFESDTHESRLRAFWSGGPQQEIEEKNKD